MTLTQMKNLLLWAMTKDLASRITSDPAILGGRPIIRGMRIRVSDILGYLAAGDTRETLLDQFPDLEDADITAALEYAQEATDHRLIAAE
jgi:uncharacterized protein (DUF433 family)